MAQGWRKAGQMMALAGPLWLGGCILQSLHPFYTAENRIDLPSGIAGAWRLTSEHGTLREGYRPWVFSGDTLTVYDEHGNPAELTATFFKIGKKLYLDTVAENPDERRLNRFWTLHVTPVHVLCRVELAKDTLTLFPPDCEWLYRTLDNEPGPAAVCNDEKVRIFTASGADWEAFLKRHAGSAEAFPARLALVFQRAPHPVPETPAADSTDPKTTP